MLSPEELAFLLGSAHDTLVNANNSQVLNVKSRSSNGKGSHSHKAAGDYGDNTHVPLSLCARNQVSALQLVLREIPDVTVHLWFYI